MRGIGNFVCGDQRTHLERTRTHWKYEAVFDDAEHHDIN